MGLPHALALQRTSEENRITQSREALVMGPIQNGNNSLQNKTGNLPPPHTQGASETLCTASHRPGPQHRQEAPEASCCLVSPPQWLPLLLTLFPLCCRGGTLLTELALRRCRGPGPSGDSGHQQLSLVTKQKSSSAPVGTFPSEGTCLRFLSALGCCLWSSAQVPLDLCPSSPALMPLLTGLFQQRGCGSRSLVGLYLLFFFLSWREKQTTSSKHLKTQAGGNWVSRL